MGKKIVIVNAGPRRGWNTDTLLNEAARGAAESGAEVRRFDLYSLDRFTGCVSCFGCKKMANEGKCVCRDGLTPVLEAIRESDGVVIGSPNYLGNLTAMFRALFERLMFPYVTYNNERPSCNKRPVPVLLIMTCNAPENTYPDLAESYRRNLTPFVGPTEVFVSYDTLQLKDYAATDWPWDKFDPEAKMARHLTVFEKEKEEVYEKGKAMGRSSG